MSRHFFILVAALVGSCMVVGGQEPQDPMPFSDQENFDQVPGFEIKPNNIKIEFVETPKRGVNAVELKRPSDPLRGPRMKWLEVEVEYSLNPRLSREELEQPGGGFFQDVMVKLHLLTPQPQRPQDLDQEVLSIELHYGPLALGEGYFASAYLSPFQVEMYGGEQAFKQSAMAAEVFVDGKRVSWAETRRAERVAEADWFLKGGKTGVLMPITKTPWAMDYWEHYPPLRESGSGGSSAMPRMTAPLPRPEVTTMMETNSP
ncbi:MAG: hypothetical protein K1X66_05775 [Verrucomicrobiae bacterium]|nr:hypothetical protein [Verrucomicrobiae bacterium]